MRGPAEEHEAVQRRRRGGRWPVAVSGGRRMDGVVGIHVMFGELRIRLQEQVRTNPIPFHFGRVQLAYELHFRLDSWCDVPSSVDNTEMC